jgi:hypothetical protein
MDYMEKSIYGVKQTRLYCGVCVCVLGGERGEKFLVDFHRET